MPQVRTFLKCQSREDPGELRGMKKPGTTEAEKGVVKRSQWPSLKGQGLMPNSLLAIGLKSLEE